MLLDLMYAFGVLAGCGLLFFIACAGVGAMVAWVTDSIRSRYESWALGRLVAEADAVDRWCGWEFPQAAETARMLAGWGRSMLGNKAAPAIRVEDFREMMRKKYGRRVD